MADQTDKPEQTGASSSDSDNFEKIDSDEVKNNDDVSHNFDLIYSAAIWLIIMCIFFLFLIPNTAL